MSTAPLIKHSGESRLYAFEFAAQPELVAGQTLSSPTVTSATSGLTIGTAVVNTSKVQAQISGGVSGTSYTLTATAATSSGSTLQSIGLLIVYDGP